MDREQEGGLSPIEMVARQVHEGCSLSYDEAFSALRAVLMGFFDRACRALEADPLSQETADRIREYRVVSEVVVTFGTTLRALEDIESHELEGRYRQVHLS